jgi:translation initiation factor 2A
MSSSSTFRLVGLIFRHGNAQVSRHFISHNIFPLNIDLVKLEDGAQHKNLRIFSVSTGEELVSFTQKSQDGWDLQYTISESHAIRLVAQEIQVYRPSEWDKGIVDRFKVEDATSIALSPGLNPSVAVFVAEKKVGS